jgi:hypothetical protein
MNVAADGNDLGFKAATSAPRREREQWRRRGILRADRQDNGRQHSRDNNDPVGVEGARLSSRTAPAVTCLGVRALAGPAKLVRTTVTYRIRDVLSARPPQVSGSTCGTSAGSRRTASVPLGVLGD